VSAAESKANTTIPDPGILTDFSNTYLWVSAAGVDPWVVPINIYPEEPILNAPYITVSSVEVYQAPLTWNSVYGIGTSPLGYPDYDAFKGVPPTPPDVPITLPYYIHDPTEITFNFAGLGYSNLTGVWLDGMTPGTQVRWEDGTYPNDTTAINGIATADATGDAFVPLASNETLNVQGVNGSFFILGVTDTAFNAHVPENGGLLAVMAASVLGLFLFRPRWATR
jgi:hypothetical protein